MELRVFERRPRWGPELQRQFLGDRTIQVVNCGLIRDMCPTDPGHRVALLLDMRHAQADVLQLLGNLQRHRTAAVVIVMIGTDDSELEWTIRELGAGDVVVGEVDGASLARLCRRQLLADRLRPENASQ